MNSIEINGLSKHYDGFSLDGLSLSLAEGSILGYIGENGAGKTTTVRLLLGLAKPDGGSFSLFGKLMDSDEALTEARQSIGVVMDEPGLPHVMNALEIGEMMGGIFENWDGKYYEELLKKLDLPSDKDYGTMSRGTRMKLGIAVALAHKPKLLILDEPTSGLDPVVRDEVLDIFADFARGEGHSVLISSHIVSDLEKLCDRIAFLHKGRLMLCEDKDTLMNEYAMLRCNEAELDSIAPGDVIGRKNTESGCSAIVRRSALPEGADFGNVTLEELFIFMVKEGQ